METETAACKLEVVDRYEAGFNTTLKQVQIIALKADILKACVWKDIVAGKLVAPIAEGGHAGEQEIVAVTHANPEKSPEDTVNTEGNGPQ